MAAPVVRPDSNPLFSDAASRLLSTRCLLELITSRSDFSYAASVSAHMPAFSLSEASVAQKLSQAIHLSVQTSPDW